MTKNVKIGLIGAGFIGAAHARAVRAMPVIFPDAPLMPLPHMLVEADEGRAAGAARRLGFERWSTDWRQAIEACDAVIIAVPSFLHRDIALAAITAGKPVLCEKPVGLSAGEAGEIAAAAADAGVANAVGFTYMRAPLVQHAIGLVKAGEMGQPLHFRGWHNEDYLADPAAPFTWRLDPKLAGTAGALGDLGWHILSLARALCGPVSALSGTLKTFHTHRPQPGTGDMRAVGNEDWAGMVVKFAGGAAGSIECSRVAAGRKMDIGFELVCEGGTIAFAGERMNELRISRAGHGFQTILADANHPDYAAFIPAPGHGLGFADLKVIELRDFMAAMSEGRPAQPDLNEAVKIANICAAVARSDAAGTWIDAPEDPRG
jgi:predicted dehydrogenase